HTVQALDEIVWAVNPENDTLNGLVAYIGHYADEFFENAGMGCRLEIPVDLPAVPLPAELRHNLFLLVKESFNNALKHSQGSEVRVGVAVDAATLRIVIQDDGSGFDPGKPADGRRGNGLENMRKRAEHLGGRCEILSAAGEGTTLEFVVPLNSGMHGRELT